MNSKYEVEVFLDETDMWRWKIRKSGRAIALSEGYKSKGKSTRTAKSIAKGLGTEATIDVVIV